MNFNRINRKWPLAFTAALLIAVLAACSTRADTPPVTQDPTRPEGVITGRITTSAGEPLDNTPVTLQEYTFEASALQVQSSALTDEHGQFGINITNPGTYALQAEGDNEGVFELITVTTEDGQLVAQDLELTAAEYGMVELTVNDPDGAPASDSLVYLAGTNHMGMTSHAGSTILTRVPAGTYTALATNGGYGRSTGLTVTVKSAETTTTDPLVLKNLQPVIHSVTPNPLLSSSERYYPTITITGENFGDQRGLGKILLAGSWNYIPNHMTDLELAGGFITAWSDTEITIEEAYLHYEELVPDEPAAPDVWNRFQVVTTAGTSNLSERVDGVHTTIELLSGSKYVYVDSPTQPISFEAGFLSSNEALLTDPAVTFTATSGDLTYGALSEIEKYEYDWGEGAAFVERVTTLDLQYTPTATAVGDTFTITGTFNGEAIPLAYECTLLDGVAYENEPTFEWYCPAYYW